MGGSVYIAESLATDAGIDLGRAQVFVSEKFLHSTQIGTSVQKMSRERVSEGVWMGRSHGPPIEDSSYVSGAEGPAPLIEENRIDG
jgi:hypothetical protein